MSGRSRVKFQNNTLTGPCCVILVQGTCYASLLTVHMSLDELFLVQTGSHKVTTGPSMERRKSRRKPRGERFQLLTLSRSIEGPGPLKLYAFLLLLSFASVQSQDSSDMKRAPGAPRIGAAPVIGREAAWRPRWRAKTQTVSSVPRFCAD